MKQLIICIKNDNFSFCLKKCFLHVFALLPVTESLPESLGGELNSRPEPIFWYWHWYDPSLSKFTLRILNVAEFVLEVWVLINESVVFFRMNDPPKTWVEIEQVIAMFWPQVTSPTGFMVIWGFGKLTEKTNKTKEQTKKQDILICCWFNDTFSFWFLELSSSGNCFVFLPLTESLTASLREDENFCAEMVFWYWHWYEPLWSKSTLWILKVADVELDDAVWLKVPEVFLRRKAPPENSDKIEQVMVTSSPQATLSLFREILGFGRLTEKHSLA